MGSYFGDSPAFLIPICFICCSCFISSPETESRHSAACRLFSNKRKHQGMLSGLNECKRCWKYYTWFVFSAQWYPLMSTCMAFLGEWSSQVVLPGNPPAKADLDPWVGKIPWSRKWQPTPVFLPGKFHEQRSLTGYSPCGHRVGHDWACTHSYSSTHFLFFL